MKLLKHSWKTLESTRTRTSWIPCTPSRTPGSCTETWWRILKRFIQISGEENKRTLIIKCDADCQKVSFTASVVRDSHLQINMFSYRSAAPPDWQVSINLGLSIKMITRRCVYLHLMILITIPKTHTHTHTHTHHSPSYWGQPLLLLNNPQQTGGWILPLSFHSSSRLHHCLSFVSCLSSRLK